MSYDANTFDVASEALAYLAEQGVVEIQHAQQIIDAVAAVAHGRPYTLARELLLRTYLASGEAAGPAN